jgi:para-nitrobenzyl esterase
MTRDWNWWCILYRPIVDGITIKQDPAKSIREGRGKNIPLMTGSAADEARYWLHWADWGVDSKWGLAATIPAVCADVRAGGSRWNLAYERMVAHAVALTGRSPEEVEAAYLGNHPGASPNDAFLLLLRDLTFRFPSIRMAENRLAAPEALDNTWMYVDNWKSLLYLTPAMGGVDDVVNGMPAGAYHESGLGFAFGLPETWVYGPWKEFAPYDAMHPMHAGWGTENPLLVWPSQLVPQHHDTWIQFATTGDPNNPNIPDWPTYTGGTRSTLLFDAEPTVTGDWCAADRLLWESVPGDPLFDCPAAVAIP